MAKTLVQTPGVRRPTRRSERKMTNPEESLAGIEVRRTPRGPGGVLALLVFVLVFVAPGLAVTAILAWLVSAGGYSSPLTGEVLAGLAVLVALGPGLLCLGALGLRNAFRMRPGALILTVSDTGLVLHESASGRIIDPPERLRWSGIDRLRLDEGPYRSLSFVVIARDGRKWAIPPRAIEPSRERLVDAIVARAAGAGIGVSTERRYLVVAVRTTWRFHAKAE